MKPEIWQSDYDESWWAKYTCDICNFEEKDWLWSPNEDDFDQDMMSKGWILGQYDSICKDCFGDMYWDFIGKLEKRRGKVEEMIATYKAQLNLLEQAKPFLPCHMMPSRKAREQHRQVDSIFEELQKSIKRLIQTLEYESKD